MNILFPWFSECYTFNLLLVLQAAYLYVISLPTGICSVIISVCFFRSTRTRVNLARRGSFLYLLSLWWYWFAFDWVCCRNKFQIYFAFPSHQFQRCFTMWITLLYHVSKQVLVRWPSKQLIKNYLPKCFFKYPRTRVVIGCTETKVEKPSAPSSQKVTWSDYKIHNTFKLYLLELPLREHLVLSLTFTLVIVSGGEWLWKPANFKGACYCYDFWLLTWHWPCTPTNTAVL